ncbi:hypothetical protein [Streptomyces sp. NPDC091217]|uniref:hypothetical protein n=1 Tax=Streptomyces sp. NPDC091217 TaxID=3365975 RepID=UPI003812986E
MFIDTAERLRDRQRPDRAAEAVVRVGSCLEVLRTARDLAGILLPGLGDYATVALVQAALDGEEPPKRLGAQDLRPRHVVCAPLGTGPLAGLDLGDVIPRPRQSWTVRPPARRGVDQDARRDRADARRSLPR